MGTTTECVPQIGGIATLRRDSLVETTNSIVCPVSFARCTKSQYSDGSRSTALWESLTLALGIDIFRGFREYLEPAVRKRLGDRLE
jgi:hypothetical protein